MHHVAAARAESYDAAGVVGRGFKRALADGAVRDGCRVGEGTVECDDEVVAEVVGNTAGVIGGVAYDLALFGDDAHVRAGIEGVDYDE